MPRILGGNWDRKDRDSPAHFYWRALYLVRNRVVHEGYGPTHDESELAEKAYRGIRGFVNDRLWERRRTFPRTTLARLGSPEALGYPGDPWFARFSERVRTEAPYAWWLPSDIRAARQAEI